MIIIFTLGRYIPEGFEKNYYYFIFILDLGRYIPEEDWNRH